MGMRETPTQRTASRMSEDHGSRYENEPENCEHDWSDWSGGGYQMSDRITGSDKSVIRVEEPELRITKRLHRSCSECGERERRVEEVCVVDVSEEDELPVEIDVMDFAGK